MNHERCWKVEREIIYGCRYIFLWPFEDNCILMALLSLDENALDSYERLHWTWRMNVLMRAFATLNFKLKQLFRLLASQRKSQWKGLMKVSWWSNKISFLSSWPNDATQKNHFIQVIGAKERTLEEVSFDAITTHTWQAKIFISTIAGNDLIYNLFLFYFVSGIVLLNCIKDTNICIDCDFTWSYSCLSRFGSSGKL